MASRNRFQARTGSIDSVIVMETPKVAAVVWIENSKLQEHDVKS